jgi:hypothetical protein
VSNISLPEGSRELQGELSPSSIATVHVLRFSKYLVVVTIIAEHNLASFVVKSHSIVNRCIRFKYSWCALHFVCLETWVSSVLAEPDDGFDNRCRLIRRFLV